MSSDTSEKGFQNDVIDYLTSTGYEKRTTNDYDTTSCLDIDLVLKFIHATQPKAWKKFEKVNKNIQRNYQNMLKTSFNFVVMFKLNINNPLNSAQAFEDENLKAKIKKEEMQIIKDIFSIITMSIKAPIKSRPDMLVIEARSPEELGRIISFIMSVCDIEKYIKAGVGYFMGVSVHSKEESFASAVEEAQKLIDLKNNRTVLCHQIVCECLKQVKHLGLSFESFGQYSTDENETLFKIVNKK